jgi:hypothetical protein
MAVNITIQEVGGNVVWTATGTLNLAGLTYESSTIGGAGFDATNAVFGSGLGANSDIYTGSITKPANFGTGGAAATSASGSYISIQSIPARLQVPAGYISGGALSGTTTYTGTFATLGLTPGTYVYSWGSGGNADTLTLLIGAQPTPTPTVTQTQTPSSTPAPISNTIEISSNNYIGQIADITFYPCSGGTTSLGEHVLPYTYQSTYYYGQYSLYFSAYNSTCTYDIVCPSPTPTSTTTPTVTPTNTPTPTNAPAGFTATVSQVGPNVVWSGSGSFNLTDLTLNQNIPSVSTAYNAQNAQFIIGPSSSVSTYSGSSFTVHPSSFGGAGSAAVSSTSGSVFGIVQTGGIGAPREVLVPQGYVSGTVISGSATFNGTTIAGMGLTSGTYTWQWGSGAGAGSLTLIIQ